MEKLLNKGDKTGTILLVVAGAIAAVLLLVSCGGGGYGGGGSYGSGMSTIAPGAFSLASPIGGAAASSTTPTLTWNASLYATGYYVYLTGGGAFNDTLIATVSGTQTMTPALMSATTYTWQVKAYNAAGMTPATNGPTTFVTP